MTTPQFDLYSNPEYNQCKEEAAQWDAQYGDYYRSVLCLEPLSGGCNEKTIRESYDKMQPFITNTIDEIIQQKQAPLCVLPKGHSGKCSSSMSSLFTHKSFQNSMAWIFTTEGDDGYIYKNRATRLFPLAIPDSIEKQIKSKDHRLSCAIPLKNATTNLMAAAATLDYAVLHYYIEKADTITNISFVEKYGLAALFATHKEKMIQVYRTHRKQIFHSDGHTLCPVLCQKIGIEHVFDSDRCNPYGIQLGHVLPRSNIRHTIRGFNLVLMTRTGNRLVGEHDFQSDDWLHILQSTVAAHHTVTVPAIFANESA
jgi:hypothetical protein